MGEVSLTQIIATLRRSQPRNPLTMRVCDELEGRLFMPVVLDSPERDAAFEKRHGFDRRAYQRTYMKKYRADKKIPKKI